MPYTTLDNNSLQRGLNQSLGDAAYPHKRNAYLSHGQNLLAGSLHPLAYENNPALRQLMASTELEFQSYDEFGPDEQEERQELYIRMAEWVWNPYRLDLESESPPVHEPIKLPEEELADTERPERYGTRLRFFEQLLPYAKSQSELHRRISPSKYHWVGARRHGQWWNYVVLQGATRVELYIDSPRAEENKAVYDALHSRMLELEASFGEQLDWQRLSDKRASRISYTVSGGWVDDSTWPAAIEAAVAAMTKLYMALGPSVEETRSRSG